MSLLARAAEEPLPKRFWQGTHRTADPGETLARVRPHAARMGITRLGNITGSAEPGETLARVRPHAARMGITRLGNITGLNRIGIPVAIAVRPNSRSVSVSQGKGYDLPQAMASALMEACEGFHAEEIGPCQRAMYSNLAQSQT